MSRYRISAGYFSRFTETETGVKCPQCGKSQLINRFSCLEANFFCESCEEVFLLEDLVKKLDDDDFSKLAEQVDGRYSDRV